MATAGESPTAAAPLAAAPRTLEEVILKVAIVGSPGVGKSTLVRQLHEAAAVAAHKFGDIVDPPPLVASAACDATIGVDFSSLVLREVLPDVKLRLQLWDTAAGEQVDAVESVALRNAAAAIVVWDMAADATFADVELRWLPLLREHDVGAVIVVANKADAVVRRGGRHAARTREIDCDGVDVVDAVAAQRGTRVAAVLRGLVDRAVATCSLTAAHSPRHAADAPVESREPAASREPEPPRTPVVRVHDDSDSDAQSRKEKKPSRCCC